MAYIVPLLLFYEDAFSIKGWYAIKQSKLTI